jgi:magnesium-transporting ATPase (P-type)
MDCWYIQRGQQPRVPRQPGEDSDMQIILVGAAIVSLVIQQWATAIGLIVITLFNALVGLRQAGKAESAMNALQSMMKASARVRRDGTESGPVTSVWGNCA